MEKDTDEIDLGRTKWDRKRVATRKLQKRGRVDLPDDWLDEKGFEPGQPIMIVECEDGFYISSSTVDKLMNSCPLKELIENGEKHNNAD